MDFGLDVAEVVKRITDALRTIFMVRRAMLRLPWQKCLMGIP